MSPPQSHGGEHTAGIRTQMRFIVRLLGVLTAGAALVWFALPPVGLLLLAGCVAGWFVVGIYFLLYTKVVNPVGDAIGRVLMPSGESTPSSKGLSHIQAMVAHGDYRKAAEAYQHEIATDPQDVASCEQLGLLAARELKDFELAVTAYREAERRHVHPGRKLASGMMAAETLRDGLRDPGRAMVELRRLLESYPDAPNAAALRAEIAQLKTLLFETP